MNADSLSPDDESFLDEVFDLSVRACSTGVALDLDALLAGREHLRAPALRLLQEAGEVAQFGPQRPAGRDLGVVAGFTVLDEAGRGGMGTVYRARQESLGRVVALKVLAPSLLMSARSRERFGNEAKALGRVRHPHVVSVHEVFAQDDLCAYAMEWVEGTTLAKAIAAHDPSLDVGAVARLGVTIARALGAVHAAGLVHRDVKPSNILLRRDGTPVLSDFGLVHDAERGMHTATGEFLGTAAYAAPEQLRGAHDEVGAWTDVYGLGVTLYAALSGQTPFATTSTAEMLRSIESGLGTPLQKLNPRVPRDLATIVSKAMDRDPQRRYRTAAELAADLERFLHAEPILARRAGLGLRLARWTERNPWVTAAMLLLVGGVAGTTWFAVEAEDQAVQALREQGRADAKVLEFDQLAGVVLYDRAIANEAALYPPWPSQVEAMERWLKKDAGELLAMREGIERTVRDLESRALPPTAEELQVDRRTYRFALESQLFLHDTLAQLLGKLGSLAIKEKAEVEQRLRWARQIQVLSLAHPNSKHTWRAVRAAIASNEKYTGKNVDLRDQDITGLVPIGENPVTKLWEFYELRSACDGVTDPSAIPIPTHERDGSIKVTGDLGIVFVLLPGCTATIGAQKDDEDGPNFDAQARDDETPPHQVALAPFFLARHELTQGQWSRLWTWDAEQRDPSQYKAGQTHGGKEFTMANPVEQVNWPMCDMLLSRHGLELPTEAQWEYGCRAGTSTPWLCTLDELKLYANVADAGQKAEGVLWILEAWSDGHFFHAPVGSFAANSFGLYDVHGNVWEWCRDVYGGYAEPVRDGDGLRLATGSAGNRVMRGGSFFTPSAFARSAYRNWFDPSFRNNILGLRPSRAITP